MPRKDGDMLGVAMNERQVADAIASGLQCDNVFFVSIV
jgi:hypothetical protein